MKKEKILYAANVLQFPKYVRNTEPEQKAEKPNGKTSKTDNVKNFMSRDEINDKIDKLKYLRKELIENAMKEPWLWPLTLETVMDYHHPTDDYIDDRYRTFLKQTDDYESEIIAFFLCEERKGTDIPRTKKGREHYLTFWEEFYDDLEYYPDGDYDGYFTDGVPAPITIVMKCMHQKIMDYVMEDNKTRSCDRKKVMAINKLCNHYVDGRDICIIWMQNFYSIVPRLYDVKKEEKELRKEFSEIFKYCLYRGGAVYVGFQLDQPEMKLHVHCYEFDEDNHTYKKVTPKRAKEFAPDLMLMRPDDMEIIFE